MSSLPHKNDPPRNLVAFFAIAFAISWLAWLPSLLISNDLADLPDVAGVLGILGPFGPFVAAFWLTRRDGGPSAVRALWRRGFSRDFDAKWLWPTVLLAPATALVTLGVMAATGQEVRWSEGVAPIAIVPTFALILLLNAAPEEYGWRGYALGGLLQRRSALGASLILGAVWGLWHLPLHFIDGTVQEAVPVYQFVLQQMVLAVFYTWLFVNTRGAVSVAILFHAVANVVGAAVPYWVTEQGRWTGFTVQVAFAAVIVLLWGPKDLRRSVRGAGADRSRGPNRTGH